MELAICSFASGSSGNCFLIKTEETAVLVDAGISGRQVESGLEALGLKTADLNAVLITHEHSDHIRGLKIVSSKSCAPVFASEGTFRGIEFADELGSKKVFCPGESFSVGDIRVTSFPTSHDAAQPSGFSFEAGGKKIAIVTDTGTVTEDCYCRVKDADILVLESNHDESVLRMGRYPWFLKQRILSDEGHLSNEAAARMVLRILQEEQASGRQEKNRLVLLAHLSKENNFPEMALQTMSNILGTGGYDVGGTIRIGVLSRTESSPLYIL